MRSGNSRLPSKVSRFSLTSRRITSLTSGIFVVAEPAGEPLRVEQRHEREEVLVLAVVRGRRQQQEVAGPVAEQLAELEALGLVELVAVEVGRHLVGLVAR